MPSDKPTKKEKLHTGMHPLSSYSSSPSLLTGPRILTALATSPTGNHSFMQNRPNKPLNASDIFKLLEKVDNLLDRGGGSTLRKARHGSVLGNDPTRGGRKRTNTVSQETSPLNSSGLKLPRHSMRLAEKEKDIPRKQKKKIAMILREFLEAVATYGKSPSELFYDRLVESGNLISADSLICLNESLVQFVEASLPTALASAASLPKISITVEDVSSFAPSGSIIDDNKLRNTAITLLNYLETHTVDPDNALVGLEVASTLIAKHNLFIEKYKLRSFRVGDLVVCKVEDSAIFARVHQYNQQTSQVQVLSSPKDIITTFPVSSVYALPPEILEMTKQERSMKTMVVDPCIKFFDEVGKAITNITIDFLSQSMGIERSLLIRLQEHKLRIIDLCILDSVLCKITCVLEQQLQHELFEKAISRETAKLLGTFMNNLDLTKVLVPLRDMMWVQLTQHTLMKLAVNNLWSLRMNCESSITQLGNRIDDILSGRAKARVTNWWLNRIETCCNCFLQELNYDFEAIPANYIEEPPTSIRAVQTNLALIQEILNPRADVHGLKNFITTLRGEIQPKLDELQEDSADVLHFRFNISIAALDSALKKKEKNKDYKREEAFKEPTPILPLPSSITSSKHVSVASLVEDIKYMREMKYMEKAFDNADPSQSKHLTLTNVVPISGLILARFHIIENELQTIMDVWRHLLPKNEIREGSIGRASISRVNALLQKHLEQATLLNGAMSDVKRAGLFSLPTRALSLKDVAAAVGDLDYEPWDLIVWVF